MSSVFYGHQRQCSGNEQLINPATISDAGLPDTQQEPVYCNPTSSSARRVELPLPSRTAATVPDMRFSTLSDCSSYYGLPDSPNENQSRHILKDPYLRANCGVVLGALTLTLVGAILIGFGLFVSLVPNEWDVHGWIFVFIGFLFAIPGFYHLWYIICALFGRAGYSFENLPTFTKPPN
jgi:hypothetical protein